MNANAPIKQPEDALLQLQAELSSHAFWNNRLFRACAAASECQTGGVWQNRKLALDDLRYVFSQYFAYSRSFTRYVAAVMASCPDDALRARLTHNLWEEGGGAKPEERHSEMYRRFLVDGMGVVDPDQLVFEDHTQIFVDTYLAATRSQDHIYATAFLSLGTEAIVARMYRIFVEGMVACGLPREQLRFFELHIAADDEHAQTLHDILSAFRDEPGWLERARRGMNDALDARLAFFEALYDRIETGRYRHIVERVRAKNSLLPATATADDMVSRADDALPELYANHNERMNILFTVGNIRAPGAEVLDPRLVKIPPGRFNERHHHAHESLFVIMDGSGEVVVGDKVVPVKTGDIVFVPRWAYHQARNTGEEELVFVAVTDFRLTSAVLGDYDRASRGRGQRMMI